MHKKLMLIDGNSIINRAFYAIPLLSNKDGEYTNAVYGFLNIFFKLYDEEQPDYVAAAFDLPVPTFRHKKYDAYKGGRKAMPDELRPQIPLLKRLLKLMNIDIYECEGFEADDIIGTLSLRAKNSGLNCVVVSGDRDMLQLADDDILIRIPKTKSGKTEIEDYRAQDVINTMGVTPREYIEVKALMGDTSDNIPGVPGIGEKTALKIITEYKSVENAILHAGEIKPAKAAENLTAHAGEARLSRELSEIIRNVPLDNTGFSETHPSDIYNGHAYDEIKRLEFKSFFSRFERKDEAQPEIEPMHIITDAAAAGIYISELITKEDTAFHIVCDNGEFMGVSFYTDNGGAFIKVSGGFNKDAVLAACTPYFLSCAHKLALDSKRETNLLAKEGIALTGVVFDAMLAGYVLNASKSSYNYDDIALDFLNETLPSLETLKGKGKNKKSISAFTDNEINRYSIKNAEVVYRAYPVMMAKLEENGQKGLYFDIELKLAEVLCSMELAGIRVDKDKLNEFGRKLDEHINGLTESIYEHAGEIFNINSTNQLSAVLFEKLKLKGSKRTKTGYSTDAEVLLRLKHDHPIIPAIMDYRTYTKLKSTYVDGLTAVISPETGRIYSTFNQAVTTTGRISSTEPNLQNIPVRLPLGRSLRKVFLPEDGYVFLDGDYSQIELRVLAHMAGDEGLIRAFREGQDIHRLTASQVFGVSFEEVTDYMRSSAKAVNFGIVYGISGYSLSEDLGITVKEAERYIDGYFKKYPGVKIYMDEAVKNAIKNGYAQTISGRRRMIPELFSSNFHERSFGERVAMNMPVQGSAADIIKIAMVRVYNRLKNEGFKSRMILQVHDELLIEARIEEKEAVKRILKEEMEQCVSLSVPLEADIKEGETWFDAK